MPRRPARAPRATVLARSFYQNVLGGRRVWPAHSRDVSGVLWFLVGTTLMEVRTDRDDGAAATTLPVRAPEELAERCWDAGFVVRVREDGAGRAMLSVIDPFGRRIDLTTGD